MNISEFAQRVGLSASAIRFYESKGFFAARRAGNGYRTFDEADVNAAEWIAIGRSFGISLDDIRTLIAEIASPVPDSARMQALVNAHLARIDDQIRHLEQMRTRLLDKLEDCPNKRRPANERSGREHCA